MADVLRQVGAVLGVEWDHAALQRGIQTIDGTVGLMQDFGNRIAGSALVQRLTQFAGAFEEQAGMIEDTAGSLGITTQALQELNYAAEQGGIRQGQMAAGLAALERNSVAAAAGSGGAAEAFRALGIHVRDSGGQVRGASDLMTDIATAMGRIENPSRRAAIAQHLFGGAGRRLLTVLHDGEGGLAQWRQEFAALGGGIGDDAIATAGQYGDSLNRMNLVMTGLRAQVANALLPVLTRLITWATDASNWFRRLLTGTEVLRASMIVLGVAATAAGLRMAAAWRTAFINFARIAAPIAIIILLIDELITSFNGGDSILNRLIDWAFGANAARDAWDGLRLAAHNAAVAIGEAFETVGRWISGVGRSLSEAWAGMQLAAHNVAFAIGEAFDGMFSALRRAWDSFVGFIERMWQRISAPFRAVGRFFGRALGAVNTEAAGAANVIAQQPGIGPGMRDALVNSPWIPRSMIPGAPSGGNTSQRTTTNNFQISTSDPQAAAREAVRLMDERTREQHDADHPEAPNTGAA